MRLATLSTSDLRRELDRREKGGDKLRAQHGKLVSRLAEIEAELAELGVGPPVHRGRKPGRNPGSRGPGRPKGSKNKRAKNSLSLLEAIVSGVRVGSTVSPAEAAAAATKAGYKSSSPNLGMMVANQLAKAPMFKRTGRGQYLHKGGGAGKAKRGRPAKKAGRKPGRPKGSKNKPKAAAASGSAGAPSI